MNKPDELNKILNIVDHYYSDKIVQFGSNPKGVDWNSFESQQRRFEELLKICKDNNFSINDYGCGYSALFEFLKEQKLTFEYFGFDISSNMVNTAAKLYSNNLNFKVYKGSSAKQMADYSVASGIFNVKLEIDDLIWKDYIVSVLDDMNKMSRKGFSFNCLTIYSDPEYIKKYLYYADPCFFFDYCKRYYSRNVALLHDYGLYEFTILVRKEAE